MTLRDTDEIVEKLEKKLKRLEQADGYNALLIAEKRGVEFALDVIVTTAALPPHGDLVDRDKIIQDYRDRMNKVIEWKAKARAAENQEGMIRAEQAEVTFFECGLMMMKAPVIVEANDRDKEEEE